MEFFIEKQLITVLYSTFLGLIFGAAYDIIRIVHVICNIASYSGENRGMKRTKAAFALFFLFDFIYAAAVTLTFSFFVYWNNSGDFRWF